ncbi:hypothetical protein Csa_010351 [Cucumis sativus]|uniref:Uncharacterized protein n=1 Tax=Cucumis sativus TaxID=3659 RepID=A0A0A0L7Z0_CUCSA|nr:hypothetical protein Csa_010351 [Cucumis sativus]
MAAHRDLSRNDLPKIGLEGFALIEEIYCKRLPKRRPRQVALAPPQSIIAIHPPQRMAESSPPIRCNQLAKTHEGESKS